MNPNDLVIIGVDTEDTPKHPLWDERINMKLEDGFMKNIEHFGVLQPILINEDNQVVDGRQRVRAARELGLEEVPVEILDAEHNVVGIGHSTNIHRTDDKPSVVAKKAYRMMMMEDQTKQDVAATFGVSVKSVENYKKFMELDSKTRKAVDTGLITFSQAVSWHGLSKEDQHSNIKDVEEGKRPGKKVKGEGNGKPTFNLYAGKHARRVWNLFIADRQDEEVPLELKDKLKAVKANDDFFFGIGFALGQLKINDEETPGLEALIKSLDASKKKPKKTQKKAESK